MEQIGQALLYCKDEEGSIQEQNDAYRTLLKKYENGEATDDWLREFLPESCFLQEFSERRGNIVRWLGLKPGTKVLELGSECGAVTETLLDMGCRVTCVEESLVKSRINAHRNGKAHSFSIYVEDAESYVPGEQYDLILVWKTRETEKIQERLKSLAQRLTPKGRLLAAFYNRYALRKWGGYRQRYHEEMFREKEEGIAYSEIKKLVSCFAAEAPQLYYPYPDHEHMIALYSDDFLPKEGELFKNAVPFQEGRLEFCNETKAFDQIILDGMFAQYTNSCALLMGGK